MPGTRHRKTLFLFHRDLRLEDNCGLDAALAESERVIPAFVFDPRQTEDHPYKSENALQFLIRSLQDLSDSLSKRSARLYLFQGETEQVVSYLTRTEGVDAVFSNRDYTPFARARDEAVSRACAAKGAEFRLFADSLLHEPEHILNHLGKPYTVFSPFFKASQVLPVPRPLKTVRDNFYADPLSIDKGEGVFAKVQKFFNPDLARSGGRAEALKILNGLSGFAHYEKTRDIPSVAGTTGLSPHNKFGTVSIREAYHAVRDELGADHPLLRQFHWRDFFTHVAHHHERVFGHAFHSEYDFLPWSENAEHLSAWKEGRTGFPVVDAGMRELNATGVMHNRARMVCASFLVKDLHLDWREGEKYFATRLADYDPCVNNGNWQWAASTGCDPVPYFRVFNPWIQQSRFDPDCAYVKKWVPELKDVPPAVLHRLYESGDSGVHESTGYPPPLVNHREEARISMNQFRFVKGSGDLDAGEMP